ncbi:MAG: PH domain-containing protein [Actinobacteria bacterium]|nr:PH domain-containing protein [Actinomycetota bacterium]
MAYPKKLLSPGEEVVSEFKPHWTAILGPLGLTLLAIALVVVLLVFSPAPWSFWGPIAVAVLWFVVTIRKLVDWMTTDHVITNERVIQRSGFISKAGKEIPLEMINTVSFNQSVFERMVGSGDVMIESAGETGQTLYGDIPRAEEKKNLIYKAREDRMLTLERGGQGVSRAEQLQILSKLHDEGRLTDAEYEAQKSQVLGQT